MATLGLILLVFAFVLAVLAALSETWRIFHLGWAAIAFWIAAELFGRLVH